MMADPTLARLEARFDELTRAIKERSGEMEIIRSINAAMIDAVALLESSPKASDLARMFGDALGQIRMPEPKLEMKGATADDLAEALTVAFVRGMAQIKLPAQAAPQVTVQPAAVQMPASRRVLRHDVNFEMNRGMPTGKMTITPIYEDA